MKLFVGALAFIVSTTSFAAMYVQPNVYMAAGPGRENYSSNLNKISAEFKRVSSADLGNLQFNGAVVAAKKITYHFHRLESSDKIQTCWSNLAFTVEATKNPVVNDVKATLDCSLNQD